MVDNETKSDRKVRKMLENWDKVKCKMCGKKISMLDAIMVDNRYFVCKGNHRYVK